MSYPIKYAVVPVKIQSNYKSGYAGYDKGIIISKCFVLESKESYRHNNDKPFGEYIVCIPYDDFNSFAKWYMKNVKKYNPEEYEPYHEIRKKPSNERLRKGYPLHVVYQLFDSYEEAREEADYKNNVIRYNTYKNVMNDKELLNKVLTKFVQYQMICEEYQKYITRNTEDLIITMDENKYSKDNEVISQLIDEFEYEEDKKQQMLERYAALKNEKKLIRRK